MSKQGLQEAIDRIKAREEKRKSRIFVEGAVRAIESYQKKKWWAAIPLHMRKHAAEQIAQAFGWSLEGTPNRAGIPLYALSKEDKENSLQDYLVWLKSPGEVRLDKEVIFAKGSREIAEKIGFNFPKLLLVAKALNWLELPGLNIKTESHPVFSVIYRNGPLVYKSGMITIKDVNLNHSMRVALKQKAFDLIAADPVLSDMTIRTIGSMSQGDAKQRFYTTFYGKFDSLEM